MKRLVICADGTWNKRDQVNTQAGRPRPTNVTKTARAILPQGQDHVDQLVFYHDGVGTGDPFDRLTGGAFGRGIEENIRVLYRFILYNYMPGDEIYMFGFSRGAFTIRSLAGFMNLVGLLEKDADYYVPEIYGCYERNQRPGSEQWNHAHRHITVMRECPTIQFMGVWDTVGSLGAPGLLGKIFNSRKYQYHDVGLSPRIANAYQALAIDERRKPFAPDLWSRPVGWSGNLEQAWFPGVHTNIGGGYSLDGLANEALHWMVEKAESHGLQFDKTYLAHYTACFNSTLNDSMTLLYRAMGQHVRPLGAHENDGEAIHQTAIDRKDLPACKYEAPNLAACLAHTPHLPVVTTTRIPRGTACAEPVPHHDD
jgi:uncharacterized protein (DUF2235 family)